jgi:hypothetical protein
MKKIDNSPALKASISLITALVLSPWLASCGGGGGSEKPLFVCDTIASGFSGNANGKPDYSTSGGPGGSPSTSAGVGSSHGKVSGAQVEVTYLGGDKPKTFGGADGQKVFTDQPFQGAN